MDLPRLSEFRAPPKSLSMVRLIKGLAVTEDLINCHAVLESRYPADTNLLGVVKAAITAGGLAGVWGSQLSSARALQDEFLEASRPSSIILRLTQARRVPFRINVPRVAASSTAYWVGEGAAKPVSALGFGDNILLDPTKVAGLVVISSELVRSSSPSAEAVIKADLISACNGLVDATFVSDDAATATSPAGILNTVVPIASTGTTPAAIAADIGSAIAGMLSAGGQAQSLVLLMHPATAATVSLTVGAAGGSLGLPVLASTSVAVDTIVVLDQSELLLADDGGVDINISREASIMMDSAPVAGTTAYTSMFQHNMVAVLAERTVNWAPKTTNAATAGVVAL